MRKLLALLCLVGISACEGDESNSHHDAVYGQWGLNTAGCALVMEFNDGAWVQVLGCDLVGGTTGLDITKGTYSITGNQIVLSRTAATCAAATRTPEVVTFAVSGGALLLTDSDGTVLQMPRLPTASPMTSSGAVGQQGCFNPDDTFTARPLTAIP